MKKRRTIRAVFALLLAAGMLAAQQPVTSRAASSQEIRQEIEALEEQQERLRQEYQDVQSQYQANADEIQDMVSRKNVIDQEIALLNQQIDLTYEQIAAYRLLIADKQDELDAANAELRRLQEENKERIRAMEEDGKLSYWSVLFNVSSFSELLDKLAMIEEIAAADNRRLDTLNQAAARVADARAQLETEKDALEATLSELDASQALLDQKRQEADSLLQELVSRSEDYERLLHESEALQSQLMAEVAELEDAYDAAKHQEWLASSVPSTEDSPDDGNDHNTQQPSSSGWLCPLSSYVLTSPFGMRLHPTLGIYRMHNGIDMAAPRNTPIYAARSGQVTQAAYQEGGAGYYVAISHGDGFASIYMHMTQFIVTAGDYVQQGQVIGYVGNSGGISTGYHLHFGISYNGVYVNPLGYI